MNIILEFEDENDLDADEIIGSIQIKSKNRIIEENDTYLDSWLGGLIDAYYELKNKDYVEVDLIEEPSPLFIKRKGEKLTMGYKGQEIEIADVSELAVGIKKASAEIVEKFKNIKNFDQNQMLEKIKSFILHISNSS